MILIFQMAASGSDCIQGDWCEFEGKPLDDEDFISEDDSGSNDILGDDCSESEDILSNKNCITEKCYESKVTLGDGDCMAEACFQLENNILSDDDCIPGDCLKSEQKHLWKLHNEECTLEACSEHNDNGLIDEDCIPDCSESKDKTQCYEECKTLLREKYKHTKHLQRILKRTLNRTRSLIYLLLLTLYDIKTYNHDKLDM